MNKRFLAIVLVCVLALVGVYALTSKDEVKPAGSADGKSKLSSHTIGANAKKVNLTEYGDYQCPACGQYHPLLKQLIAEYKNDIQFQFRNYPLQQIHPNARAASRAAEAAGKQDRFWEMHDKLYEQQDSWKNSSSANTIFNSYAGELGLNVSKFKTDFMSSEINDIITADYNEGTRLGVNSTPTFFLQGKKITNPQTLDDFKKLIDDAIKNAQ